MDLLHDLPCFQEVLKSWSNERKSRLWWKRSEAVQDWDDTVTAYKYGKHSLASTNKILPWRLIVNKSLRFQALIDELSLLKEEEDTSNSLPIQRFCIERQSLDWFAHDGEGKTEEYWLTLPEESFIWREDIPVSLFRSMSYLWCQSNTLFSQARRGPQGFPLQPCLLSLQAQNLVSLDTPSPNWMKVWYSLLLAIAGAHSCKFGFNILTMVKFKLKAWHKHNFSK